MNAPVVIGDATLYLGDCIDVLQTLGDASIDSIVCDPPYHLTQASRGGHARTNNPEMPHGRHRIGDKGFMGKVWDGGDIAHNVEMWAECLRVLKPGGHLLAFSGTRTQHRMVCAIEDAGFEVRDQIGWLYGSGFPKSLDVSKAIDRADDYKLQASVRRAAVAAVENAGLILPGNSRHDWTVGDHAPGNKWWTEFQSWLPGLTDEQRDRIEGAIVAEVQKAAGWFTSRHIYTVRAPATDAAMQWSGWGTALKPAWEPICVARKPLAGTVAANVLAHGTGALNIDACRVHADDAQGGEYTVKRFAPGASVVKDGNWKRDVEFRGEMKVGRWPANVIHDGSPEVLAAFPDAPGQMADAKLSGERKTANVYGVMRYAEPSADRTYEGSGSTNFAMKPGARRLDTGSAARFFYCAKASRADRHEGLEVPGAVFTHAGHMREVENIGADRGGNHHPTVKPTELMAYLCRLVTPPGGVVLDPFMGSGSTGKAAMREGFRFIGIDMTLEYVDIAKARIQFEIDHVEQERERIERERIEAARQPDMFAETA